MPLVTTYILNVTEVFVFPLCMSLIAIVCKIIRQVIPPSSSPRSIWNHFTILCIMLSGRWSHLYPGRPNTSCSGNLVMMMLYQWPVQMIWQKVEDELKANIVIGVNAAVDNWWARMSRCMWFHLRTKCQFPSGKPSLQQCFHEEISFPDSCEGLCKTRSVLRQVDNTVASVFRAMLSSLHATAISSSSYAVSMFRWDAGWFFDWATVRLTQIATPVKG